MRLTVSDPRVEARMILKCCLFCCLLPGVFRGSVWSLFFFFPLLSLLRRKLFLRGCREFF